MNDSRHVPVMVDEVLKHLLTDPHGAYLDLTVGLGGHLNALASNVSKKARLYGLDRDSKALEIAAATLESAEAEVFLENASYAEIDTVIEKFKDKQFDGILLDLGLSSLQIDDPKRGFSHRFASPLDMRFDPDSDQPNAADIINQSSQKELKEIFYTFGEEKKAGLIAKAIVTERQREMILTTTQLKDIISRVIYPPYRVKSLARVFQALRIVVNGELDQLKEVLPKTLDILKEGGRLVILTYHSIEDRLVKQFYQYQSASCVCPPGLAVCICQHQPKLKVLTRKALTPSRAEVEANNRARSAQLRAAEKI